MPPDCREHRIRLSRLLEQSASTAIFTPVSRAAFGRMPRLLDVAPNVAAGGIPETPAKLAHLFNDRVVPQRRRVVGGSLGISHGASSGIRFNGVVMVGTDRPSRPLTMPRCRNLFALARWRMFQVRRKSMPCIDAMAR